VTGVIRFKKVLSYINKIKIKIHVSTSFLASFRKKNNKQDLNSNLSFLMLLNLGGGRRSKHIKILFPRHLKRMSFIKFAIMIVMQPILGRRLAEN